MNNHVEELTLAATRVHEELLAEQTALRARDVEQLAQIAARKHAALETLMRLDAASAARAAPSPVAGEMGVAAGSSALTRLLEQCSELNRQNRVLVNSGLRHCTRLLSILKGTAAEDEVELYGPKTSDTAAKIGSELGTV